MRDEDVAEAIAAFQSVALGDTPWLQALETLARLTGSMGGELIGLGSNAAVPFNWMTGMAPEASAEFVSAGGGDPRVNSRVRVGMAAPELTVLDETAFTSAEDAKKSPAYGEWLRRHDLAFACLSPLLRQDKLLVGLALMRNEAQGNVTAEQRRAFSTIAPHVRAAVRTQMAIDTGGVALAAKLLDALSCALFACDGQGRVLSMSPTADAMAVAGGVVRVVGGLIAGARETDTTMLRAAIGRAAADSGVLAPPPRPVVLRDRHGERPVLAEICVAPAAYALQWGAAALVVIRPPGRDEAVLAAATRDLFHLTPAEALVAARLAGGMGPQAVAESTGVAVGTIRSHIRRIFEKCGVRTQVELVALLARI